MVTCAVLERGFARFGVVIFTATTGVLLQLRSAVGDPRTPQPRFNFTGPDPDYFGKTTSDPLDWLRGRAANDSKNGETSYLEAWKYLAPPRDYALLGVPESDMKWQVTHTGRIRRASIGYAVDSDAASALPVDGVNGTVFDPRHVAAYWPASPTTSNPLGFTDRKSGYVGGHLRVLAHSSWDAVEAKGFTMMALASGRGAAAVSDTAGPQLLVRLRDVDAEFGSAAATVAKHRYFGILDDFALCQNATVVNVTAAAFYTALVAERMRWDGAAGAFSGAMGVTVPYASRRNLDVAKGVIVGGMSVYLRNYEPNYGTGGYWCVACNYAATEPYIPGKTGNGKGCACHANTASGASLPLTALAMNNAMLEWGMIDAAKAYVGYYLQEYIYDTPTITGTGAGNTSGPPVTVPPSLATGVASEDAASVVSFTSQSGCTYGAQRNHTSLHGCAKDSCKAYATFAAAASACDTDNTCGGVNELSGAFNARLDLAVVPSPYQESAWLITNAGVNGSGCRPYDGPPAPPADYEAFRGQLINMEGWSDGCLLADGIPDYGRLLDMFVKTSRYSGDPAWRLRFQPKAVEMAKLLIGWRAVTLKQPATSIARGLIWGPPEHDTCGMPGYYFSNNAWSWRGLVELGDLLVEQGNSSERAYGASLLVEAAGLHVDIMRAAAASAVNDSVTGEVLWLPPTVGPGQTPWTSMTANTYGASYSNFRYWAETLSARCLGPVYDDAIMKFRETKGGTLDGMTRFVDHLDDMPTVGYAWSDLMYDRVPTYLSLFGGHVGNYNSPGTFWSVEQMSLQGEGRWRAYLGGTVDTDYCVPSSMLPAFMLKWQLIMEATDDRTIWLGKAAPRIWWAPGAEPFGVSHAPTRWGRVSYTAQPPSSSEPHTANVAVTLAAVPANVTLSVRVRRGVAGSGNTLAVTKVVGATVISVDVAKEVVLLTPTDTTILLTCTV